MRMEISAYFYNVHRLRKIYKMESETYKLASSANSYYYGLVIAAILAVIVLIVVVYFASERSKMDVTINNMVNPDGGAPEPQAADGDTIVEILEKGYLRAATIVAMVGIVVGTVVVGYLAYRVGALTGALTPVGLALIAAAAAMIYILVRLVEAAMNLSTTTATNHPAFVYESVRNIEQLLTATLGLLVFYAGITFVSYMGARKAEALMAGNAPNTSFAAAPKEGLVGGGRPRLEEDRCPTSMIPGGFVNYRNMQGHRAGAVSASKQ